MAVSSAAAVGLRSGGVRIFISYAYDSDEHREAVRRLWVFLRRCGLDAQLDLEATAARQDWSIWMTEQIDGADYVLVVASPAYRRRAEGGAAPDDGRGVQFEAALLRDRLFADRARWLPKILPVLLPGRSIEEIPGFLQPYAASRYEVREFTVAGAEELLRVLTGQPRNPAPGLGAVPYLPPEGGAPEAVGAALRGLRQRVTVEVHLQAGRLVTRTELAGGVLGERTAVVPVGIEDVWQELDGDPRRAEQRLADAGRQLCEAMFDATTLEHLVELIDHSALGTVVDVMVVAHDAAIGLPFELLRLPDGRSLATVATVRVCRRLAGVHRPSAGPLPGPLKILTAVGAPDETRTQNPPLDIEAEMQAIVDAVIGVGRDGDAEVTILEVGGLDEITTALKTDQYHVLHLSAHGSPTGVELENEDGDPIEVSAETLVERLRGTARPLPLIVLSSCAGAGAGMHGLAVALIRHGADRVIAMQASVTDGYATRLAGRMYQTLATEPAATVGDALAEARRTLEDKRQAEIKAGGPATRPECGVPTLSPPISTPPSTLPIRGSRSR